MEAINDVLNPQLVRPGLTLGDVTASRSVRPPNPPWVELRPDANSGGYLSIFYSDDTSPLPVRAVSRKGDNKSDPNLETLSYGLFSTCGSLMRSSIVKRNLRFLFFASTRHGERKLCGYYRLGWYARGVYTGKDSEGDYCLAAESCHFINTPIGLSEIDRQYGTKLSRWFRNARLVSAEECGVLIDLLHSRPDATPAYISEIDRLERFSLSHVGYRYPTWRETRKFTWEMASDLLDFGKSAEPREKISNSSPSGRWVCLVCNAESTNKSLLKRCPQCREVGSLRACENPA